jgi:hypothetical protein
MHPVWIDNSIQLNPNRPQFNVVTATVIITPPGGPIPGPGPGGGGGSGALFSGDPFDPNNSADTAANLGTLTTGSVQTHLGLTISNNPDGSPNYDWFKVTIGNPGTFAVGMKVEQLGPLELHLFKFNPATGANTEVSEATAAAGQTVGAAAVANVGDVYFVEVHGAATGPDTQAQGTYDLQLQLQ